MGWEWKKMKLHTAEEFDKVKQLAMKGKSYRQISRETGIPRRTFVAWLSGEHLPAEISSRRIVSDKYDEKNIPCKEWARVIGYFIAEGSILGDEARLSNTDKGLIDDFVACVRKVFDYSPPIRIRDYDYYPKKQHRVRIYAKSIIEHLKKYKIDAFRWHIPSEIKKKKELFKEFLYSYWRGDGRSNRNCVISANKKGLKEISECIEKFYGEVRKPYFHNKNRENPTYEMSFPKEIIKSGQSPGTLG